MSTLAFSGTLHQLGFTSREFGMGDIFERRWIQNIHPRLITTVTESAEQGERYDGTYCQNPRLFMVYHQNFSKTGNV
jgi:hypothetical protein